MFSRLANASGASFLISAEDQRLRKTFGGNMTYFIPDTSGTLLADNQNGTWRDYVWLNGRTVAMMTGGSVYAVHADQTGRAMSVTAPSKSVTWASENDPFDRSTTTGSAAFFALGFPGQYRDAEDNLWHNGFRDYDAKTGRYIQSDPVGLESGVNTYVYVLGNPVSSVDPLGLATLGSSSADCKANAALNALAQVTPYVGLGLVIADKNFTPLGNGPIFTDSPATYFDKISGVAGTLADEVASPWGERLANDIINSRFYDKRRGNRAMRKFQRNVDTYVTWGAAKQVAKYAGRALGVIGAISAGSQGVKDWQACGCEGK